MTTEPKPRGFALFTPETRREIGRLGGKSVHERGTAHRFTSEQARVASRKGGIATHERGIAPRFTSETGRAAFRHVANVRIVYHADAAGPVLLALHSRR